MSDGKQKDANIDKHGHVAVWEQLRKGGNESATKKKNVGPIFYLNLQEDGG